jgi:hypothetical protein
MRNLLDSIPPVSEGIVQQGTKETVVTNPELIEVYKLLLQQETTNHANTITILLWIVIVLLGVSWLWNAYGVDKRVSDKVKKKFDSEKKSLLTELRRELIEQFESQDKHFNRKTLKIEYNVMRSMANITSDNKYYIHSIDWWSCALETAIKLENGRDMRSMADVLIVDLNHLKVGDEIPNLKNIIARVNQMPETLNIEKKLILDKLSKMKDLIV